MIDTKKIIEAAERNLQGTDMYVVGCTCTPGNDIELLIDSDTSVAIDACVRLSRSIEEELDRDEEDFSLTVASAGIGSELKCLRQYRKLVGSTVEVLLTSGIKVLAKLDAADDQGIVDVWPEPSTAAQLKFRIPRFRSMMGAQIPREFIVEILERLGCKVEDTADEGVLDVVSPTFRPDLPREIDLYEEVLRLYGMDLIPETLPGGRGRFGVRSHMEHVLDTVNRTMTASGLNETMTYSFAEPTELERLRMPVEGLGDPVELINPMNSDQSVMRQSIIPGLLRSVAHNQARGVKNIQLYEQGMVFFAHEGKKQPKERRRLAGVMAGAFGDAAWNAQPAAFDFFDGKGVVENLMRELAIPKVRYKALSAQEAPHLQPGRAAQVLSGGTVLGWVGELHPLACAAYDAQAPVVAFELDVEALAKACRPARDYVDVPTFPAVSIDQAFVVDEEVTHERLEQCMSSAGGKLLAEVRLFDVYRDPERVGQGKKSMAYALTYRAADRTLTGEEVDKAHAKLVKKVCGATGAEVRA